MIKFDLLAIISVLTNKSERLVLIMRKNGLMIAGMIIILSAAGLLLFSSIVAIATTVSTYRGFSYYFGGSPSINSTAKYLSAAKLCIAVFASVAVLALIWAFANKKGAAICGVVASSLAMLWSLTLVVTAIESEGELFSDVYTPFVWLIFIAIACVILFVGSILKLVGVNKLNKQLSQENSAA